MVKILTNEQQNLIDNIRKTFPNPVLVNPKDMAVLSNPKKFDHVNHARHNQIIAENVARAIKELTFLLDKLPPHYWAKIHASGNGKQFRNAFFNSKSLQLLANDDKTSDFAIYLACQLLIESITVLKAQMPKQFRKTLRDAVLPFVNLLSAISDYGRKHSLKDIPYIQISNLFSIDDKLD